MTPTERLHTLQRLAADLDHLHVSLDKMRELDVYLRDEWGIRLFRSFAEQQAAIARQVDPKVIARYQFLLSSNNKYRSSGRRFPASLENEFYDILAQDPLFGLFNSHARTKKLDTVATLTALIQKLDIRGPVLDVGCNVGYMTLWLARHSPVQFVGVDFSQRSIEYARSRALGVGNVRFDTLDYVRRSFARKYDLVLCSSGFPDVESSADVLRNIARSLIDGGLCVLAGMLDTDLDYTALKTIAKKHRLGFSFLDKLGGWRAEEFGYDHNDFLVLVKGVDSPLPAKLERGTVPWDEFLRYAKSPDVPCEEQSVGYYRAKKSEGKLPPGLGDGLGILRPHSEQTAPKKNATPRRKSASTPRITAEAAADAIHRLLHEIDEKDHAHVEGSPERTFLVRYDCSSEEDFRSSTGHLLITVPYVEFRSKHCLVSFYRPRPALSLDDLLASCAGEERQAPKIPEEDLAPDKPTAVIEYTDPDLLGKVFRALASLGMRVPRNLGPKIKAAQKVLSVGTPSSVQQFSVRKRKE